MKKRAMLLVTGSLLTLAACTNENNGGMTQTQIDSAVDARVKAMEAELAMKNDSMINALAQIKADSMIAAMGHKNTAAASTPAAHTTHTATTHTTTKPVTPPPNSNTGKVTGQQGTNTGKIDAPVEGKGNTTTTPGTNTGKRR